MAHLYIAMQFGLYTAAFVYFAYRGGAWLDIKFNSYPVFTMLTIIVSVIYSFFSLIHKMDLVEKHGKGTEDEDNKKK
jgi:hypothetical protein